MNRVAEVQEQMQANQGVACEMPRYQCYKQVWALKIEEILVPETAINQESDGSRIIVPADPRYGPSVVTHEYVRKHKPEAGGYFVVYDGGYKSFSPAKEFEEGYFPRNGVHVQVQEGTHGPKRAFFTLQDGPIKEVGRNGVQIDEVIEFARGVIAGFNAKFPCRENSIALTKLDEAMLWLLKRKLDREARMVEGIDRA